MNYEPRMKAGPLRNGWERGHGSVFHAVSVGSHDQADALCGTFPAIMWSSHRPEGQAITCPRCLRRIEKEMVAAALKTDCETVDAIAWLFSMKERKP